MSNSNNRSIENLIRILKKGKKIEDQSSNIINYLQEYKKLIEKKNKIIEKMGNKKNFRNIRGIDLDSDKLEILKVMRERQELIMRQVGKVKNPRSNNNSNSNDSSKNNIISSNGNSNNNNGNSNNNSNGNDSSNNNIISSNGNSNNNNGNSNNNSNGNGNRNGNDNNNNNNGISNNNSNGNGNGNGNDNNGISNNNIISSNGNDNNNGISNNNIISSNGNDNNNGISNGIISNNNGNNEPTNGISNGIISNNNGNNEPTNGISNGIISNLTSNSSMNSSGSSINNNIGNSNNLNINSYGSSMNSNGTNSNVDNNSYLNSSNHSSLDSNNSSLESGNSAELSNTEATSLSSADSLLRTNTISSNNNLESQSATSLPTANSNISSQNNGKSNAVTEKNSINDANPHQEENIESVIQELTPTQDLEKEEKAEEEEENSSSIIEAKNNDDIKLSNPDKAPSNNISSIKLLENNIEKLEESLDTKNDKFRYYLILKLDLDYDSLDKEKLDKIIKTSIQGDIINLMDTQKMEPNITYSPGSVVVKITNLSKLDYGTGLKFKARLEEHITNKYLDIKESKSPENIKEEKIVEEYPNIKYYEEKDGDYKFYNGDGKNITFIKVENRIINITRITKNTKILYANVLKPIPKKLIMAEKSMADTYNNSINGKEDLTSRIKRKTQSTLSKIKNSFSKLISKKEKIEEPVIIIKKRKPRTLKNNYTFHQIPNKKMKNSSILKAKTLKPKIKSPKKKIMPIKKKIQRKKIVKRAKKLKKLLINNHRFHKIKKR